MTIVLIIIVAIFLLFFLKRRNKQNYTNSCIGTIQSGFSGVCDQSIYFDGTNILKKERSLCCPGLFFDKNRGGQCYNCNDLVTEKSEIYKSVLNLEPNKMYNLKIYDNNNNLVNINEVNNINVSKLIINDSYIIGFSNDLYTVKLIPITCIRTFVRINILEKLANNKYRARVVNDYGKIGSVGMSSFEKGALGINSFPFLIFYITPIENKINEYNLLISS